MADANYKSGHDDAIHQLRLKSELETPSRQRPPYAGEEVIDLGPYVAALWDHRLMIAASVMVTMVLTMLLTAFVLTRNYRASSIIRPVPKAANVGRIVGILGGGGTGLSPLSAMMGIGGPGSDEAQEYMTILSSFAFNTALINQHHLGPELTKPSSNPIFARIESQDPRWRAYKRVIKRFSCEYSLKTGNLTLYFIAKTPADAERILSYYVDDLREKLRSREVQGATAAVESMKAEARVTPDALLQTQLYELIAKQMQQLKLAQVQADFAFTEIEPPAAPDKAYSPSVLIDTAVVGFLALVFSASFVIFREIKRKVETARRAGVARLAGSALEE